MTTIAQAYVSLLYDDESGRPLIAEGYIKGGLAAATLIDLALAGRIALTGKGGLWSPRTIAVVAEEPVGDQGADRLLGLLAADKPRTPSVLLPRIARGILPPTIDQLVEDGIMRRERGRVFGVVPREYWPTLSTGLEDDAREKLRHVLLDGAAPTLGQAALIQLLRITTGLSKAVPGEARTIRRRAAELGKAAPAPSAAAELIDAVLAALREYMSSATATPM